MANISKSVKLGVFTLAIMNVTAVVSLRGLPAEAEYGLSSAFYYLFAAIVFLIPTSLVAAELAAMFQDKQGGVFRWVGEAYGKKFGFLAIFLQWVESTIWYPTVLTFGAVALAFIGMSDTHDMALASNRYYSLAVVLIIYWLATFISLKGPVKDTIKVVGIDGEILTTPSRAGLIAVHTPQTFRGDILKEAYKKAEIEKILGTDDSFLVERVGEKVKVITGDYDNIKITTLEDLLSLK